jgi:dTDP-4-amino-4,6-dideoxygalactose transaminase
MKNSLNDLAIMGGKALFDRELHVGCPNTGDRDRFMARVNDILDRKVFTNNGPYLREFEEKVAGMAGVKHCVALCNGTIALELTARALGLKGEVILPSLTFVATVHALRWIGIKPVFCDVDPKTLCLDPDEVRKLITPETSGIIGVHVFGRMCATEELEKIAREHGLKLFFDAAHAIGCTRGGRFAGSFGNAEVFSFHATKIVNSFEGGAVLTDDEPLAERLRLMRNFGFKGIDNVIELGTNAKMGEISAAMGLTSLESFADNVRINKRNYEHFCKLLADVPGISMFEYDLQEKNNFQYAVLHVDEKVAMISRDDLLAVLRAENILARRYFYPGCHRMPPYAAAFENSFRALPITDRADQQLMQLPSGPSIGLADIEKMCALIRFCSTKGQEIKESRRPVMTPQALRKKPGLESGPGKYGKRMDACA